MQINSLKQKKELIPLLLLGGAALFAVLILAKTTGFFTSLAKAENIVHRAMAQTKTNSENIGTVLAKHQSLAQQLKTNNLFAPPPPKVHPVKEISGIFGDEALINGKWYKVGSTVGDARILAIGPASVTVTWNDTEKVFLPIDAANSESSKGPASQKRVSKSGGPGRSARTMPQPGKKPAFKFKGKGQGERSKGQADWARRMSLDELRGARRKIEGYIEGLRAKGVTDPRQYEGARQKMEAVDRAIDERDGK